MISVPIREITVRLVARDEVARWQELMARHHYLGFPGFVGERLYQVAEWNGQWVALLGWTAAAYRCRARDAWIGWTPEQRRRRLRFVANNARFLILPDAHVPNLGSRVLGLALRRLARDWQAIHGHPVILAETFIDPSRFRGTVYRAAHWQTVGLTLGFGRHQGTYVWHGQAKPVAVRPLVPQARAWLTAVWDARFDCPRRDDHLVDGILSTPSPEPHGPLSGSAGCPQAARRAPRVYHHPHHRLSRHRRRLHQFVSHWRVGRDLNPRPTGHAPGGSVQGPLCPAERSRDSTDPAA